MVEHVRKSLESLQPPECPACAIEMVWYSAQRFETDPPEVIHHRFACPRCGKTKDTTGERLNGGTKKKEEPGSRAAA